VRARVRFAVLDPQGLAAVALDHVEIRRAERHLGRFARARMCIVDQGRRVRATSIDQGATVLCQHHGKRAIDSHGNRAQVRRASAQHNVIVRGAANAIRTFVQPLQADQAQPAIRRLEVVGALGLPLFDRAHIVRVDGGNDGDAGGKHGGDGKAEHRQSVVRFGGMDGWISVRA
jgi:hypothetical protein